MTYCGIGALSFLDRLPGSLQDVTSKAQELGKGGRSSALTGLPSLDGTIRWLVERQTAYFPADEEGEEEEDEVKDTDDAAPSQQEHERTTAKTASECWPHEIQYAGFSGRRNKKDDTCYSFWVGGSLAVSPPPAHSFNLLHIRNRRYT